MANVVCPNCEEVNLDTRVSCSNCQVYLPVLAPEPEPEPEISDAMPTPICDRCQSPIPDAIDRCPYCPLQATLRFPWGDISITEGQQILVGRHVDSPVAGDLSNEDWNNISRRHARFTLTCSELQVQDLGSTNGTYLNGVAVPSQNPIAVASTDIVQLGNNPKLPIVIVMD